MPALFITSVGTGIGKTLVTAALASQLRACHREVEALKPVVTGFDETDFGDSDPAILLAAMGRTRTIDEIKRITPFRFEAPLAPSMAAEAEGRTLDTDELIAFCRTRIATSGATLIEGVGGVMVPLTRHFTVLDWLGALQIPAMLVTGTYLGALSHTLTALETLSGKGLSLSGIVVSESAGGIDLAAMADALAAFTATPIVCVPRISGSDPWLNVPDLTHLIT